jgi:hypothetical protein
MPVDRLGNGGSVSSTVSSGADALTSMPTVLLRQSVG